MAICGMTSCMQPADTGFSEISRERGRQAAAASASSNGSLAKVAGRAQQYGVSSDEVQALLEKMKKDLLSEVRSEVQAVLATVRESSGCALKSLSDLQTEAQRLREDMELVKERVDRGPLARALGVCASTICGGGVDNDLRRSCLETSKGPSRQKTPPVQEEKEKSRSPSSCSPPRPPIVNGTTSGRETLLSPLVDEFEAAVRGSKTIVRDIDRAAFVNGLEEYARILDRIVAGMGSYLATNIKKLQNSKADSDQAGYRDWLITELPLHKATGYREYVDDSAWMANLWIGWALEFCVEMFAEIQSGKGTTQSVEQAYHRTLHGHHNFFQRAAFVALVKKLPCREQLLELLSGSGGASDVLRDMEHLVASGRLLVKFCLQVNDELDAKRQVAHDAERLAASP